MKPYAKTFRQAKTHKATECDLCAEMVDVSSSPIRLEARKQINCEDLRRDDIAQAEYNEEAEWWDFVEGYYPA